SVGRPSRPEIVDACEEPRRLCRIERRRDSENPDARVVGQIHAVQSTLRSRAVSFAKLMQRFKGGMTAAPHERQDPLHLATAAVLLEIAYADGEFSPAEDGDVVGFLQRAFALTSDAAQELIHE